MSGTLVRLAFAGIRTRVLASTLTVLLTAVAAATIVLALEVGSTAADPWMRTFDAAHGAHLLANVPTEADAATITGLPDVSEYDEPVPVARVKMVVGGREVEVFLASLAVEPRINVPVVTEGHAPGGGEVLLERSLARALGIDVGTVLNVTSQDGMAQLKVAGTAISPAQARYPRSNPGLAWTTRTTFEQVVPGREVWRWMQGVRLTDPDTAPVVASQAEALFPPQTVAITPWQEQRAEALLDTQPVTLVLTVYAMLLLLVSIAVVAILVGARVTSQGREIGLLKAIGLTPTQVGLVFVIEAAVLGAAGVILGFVPGALLAPLLAASSSDTLLDAPDVAADPIHALFSASLVLPVVVVTAFVASRRRTRLTVLRAIRADATVPGSRSRVARYLAVPGLPLSLSVGLKDLLARRARGVWLMIAVGVTSAAIVVTVCVQAALSEREPGVPSDVPAELIVLILALDAVLAVLTLTALMSVALLSGRERVRDFGVLRTLGLTPNQVTLSLAGAHTALALIASIAAVPAGVLLYLALYAAASDEGAASMAAPWWWLLAVPPAVSVATAIVTGIPARLAAHIPTAEAVRYE